MGIQRHICGDCKKVKGPLEIFLSVGSSEEGDTEFPLKCPKCGSDNIVPVAEEKVPEPTLARFHNKRGRPRPRAAIG